MEGIATMGIILSGILVFIACAGLLGDRTIASVLLEQMEDISKKYFKFQEKLEKYPAKAEKLELTLSKLKDKYNKIKVEYDEIQSRKAKPDSTPTLEEMIEEIKKQSSA